MAFSVRRLYRKDDGTYFLRIILGPPASTSVRAGRQRTEVRCSLRTTDRDRAIEIAALVNAQLKLARSMTHRKTLMNAIRGNIRSWTIGPEGISALPGEDTEALLQAVNAHPDLLRALAPPPNPDAGVIRQMMAETIQSKLAELQTLRAGAQGAAAAPEVDRPRNPMRFSDAMDLHVASGYFVERTAADKRRLLTSLRQHIALCNPELGADPFVHQVQTHHLSSFLDDATMKRQTDGTVTAESASPATILKKMSDFSAFFKWALDERQATPTDPTLALTKRAKDLKKATVKVQRHYSPFKTEQIRSIFSPKHYVCFNRSADHFWAPLLALHLGTRLKEVVTLSLDDIDLHKQSGVWFLDVTPELAKNANSVRRLPLPR